MNPASFLQRLALCSWSLQPSDPHDLLAKARQTGISRLQIALDPFRVAPDPWGALPGLCAGEGIQLVSGMFGTVGEDYSTLESIRLTGGIVPDSTWEENRRNIEEVARWAHKLGLSLVSFHAGFLPEKQADPGYQKLQARVREVADVFAEQGIHLAFETGQETAEVLIRFLEALDRANVGVNFDPANLLLYDKGDPLESLRQLAPWLKQCHLKDACRTSNPGTWGEEVPVGAGQVDWLGFFAILGELNFDGVLALEREAGNERVTDITTGRRYVEALLSTPPCA